MSSAGCRAHTDAGGRVTVDAKPPKQIDPYYLDADFEAEVALLCATSGDFWARIGHALNPDALASESAKTVLRACGEVARETGAPPCTMVIVVQRCRRWFEAGKLTQQACSAVRDYLLDASDRAERPREDAVVAELLPLVKKRLNADIVRTAMDDWSKGDFEATRKALDIVGLIGTPVRAGLGIDFSAAAAAVAARRLLTKMPTSIAEVDLLLEGGLRRTWLGMVVGPTGGAKSMTLSHIAAQGSMAGYCCAYASMELDEELIAARAAANILGIPISSVEGDAETWWAELNKLRVAQGAAPIWVRYFPPKATTMADIDAWIDAKEQASGRRCDALFTDPSDRLIPQRSKIRKSDSGYAIAEHVFIEMSEVAKRRDFWHWTAGQAQRQKDTRILIGSNDVADSMHKARIADLIISANRDALGMFKWNIAKNRDGFEGASGPTVSELSCGRVAEVPPYLVGAPKSTP